MAGKIQHYHRMDYIQPPPGPPTLDAKNSPLALLAQTCSAIGKESSATRKLSSQAKIYNQQDGKKSPGDVLTKPNFLPSVSSVVTSSTSENKDSSLSINKSLKRESERTGDCASPLKKSRTSPEFNCSREIAKPHGQEASSDQRKLHLNDGKRRSTLSADEAESKRIKSDQILSRNKYVSVSPNSSRSFVASYACSTSSSNLTDSSRAAPQTTSPQQHMFSMYDPYCLGCQGPHLSGNPCLEGFKLSQFPMYPFGNPASAYPFYAQMLMAARNAGSSTAVEPSPQHICNWVSNETGNCGKRFATAEELFNHLRTHALGSTNTATSGYLLSGLDKVAMNPYAAYLSQAAALVAASSPTSNPVNAGFLSRSHSPLSRFQSYKSNGMFSQLSGLPSLPIAAAGMGPYTSPYSLYSQRIGSGISAFSYP